MNASPTVVEVDFNEVYDDDYIWAVIRSDVPGAPSPTEGDWVLLVDMDGASCWGSVISRTRKTIECKIDWPTWTEVHQHMDDLFIGPYEPATLDQPLAS